MSSSLSGTKLAAYHHYSCDLYLHNAYHRDPEKPATEAASEIAQANFQRGIDWERSCLFPHLDRENLLLTIPPNPIDVDAKASKAVKTSHHVQVYFYHLCLSYLLPRPFFQPADSAAIWLPPANGFDADICPSLEDLRSININLLAPSLDDFLFRRLPQIVFRPREDLQSHLNPLCHGCPFESDCTERTIQGGKLGTMPNISLAQVEILRSVIEISRSDNGPSTTDIEDLHHLLGDPAQMRKIELSHPSTVNKAKRILAMRHSSLSSPVLEAARTRTVISRRNFTLPRREDVAVIISVVIDPSSSKQRIAYFCMSVFSSIPTLLWEPVHGPESAFVSTLSSLLKDILSLNEYVKPAPLTQIYVFSSNEEAAIKAHLVEAALTSSSVSVEDLRLCIGSIVDGAALLQTNFQPLVLSGALLSFDKSQFRRPALQTLLERMNLPASGTVDQLRSRIDAKVHDLQSQSDNNDRRTEMGQLPRVVILKKEMESLLALPVPGSWDLVESARTLLHRGSCDRNCPSDEDILITYRHNSEKKNLSEKLEQRNASIYAVLEETRRRVIGSSTTILLNQAKCLTGKFLDLCEEDNLRKLFFMSQFEVLAKLSELWKARIEGCSEAPLLEYSTTRQGEHIFYLVAGTIDVTGGGGSNRAFYDYLLVEDEIDPTSIPPEAFFDDLSLSGCLFPLNRNTKGWDNQNPIVLQKLCVANVRDVALEQNRTKVTLHTWGNSNAILRRGSHYRLSPRLVDFNTSKVLSTLLELDIKASTSRETNVPFLQLVVDPRSFADDALFREKGKELIKAEASIQSMFRRLKDLSGLEQIAGALVLKPSQHRAVQRILSSRLSVLWGPPGTGKTYTVALALLRLLESYHRLGNTQQHIVFITAMTHAAIDAVHQKLVHLLECYLSIESLPTEWLKKVKIERVLKGNEHASPSKSDPSTSVFYLGTVYQLHNFSKRHLFEVDVCVIDEAGQLALSSAALVLRNLRPQGRIVVAGDSEQLAPILTAAYPNQFLFGSILDCLMHFSKLPGPNRRTSQPPSSPTASDYSASSDTIVQLTENFRLNPDLAAFVSTIYSRAFKPQKVQGKHLAAQLKAIEDDMDTDRDAPKVLQDVRRYVLALSSVMLRKPQTTLRPPSISEKQQVPLLNSENISPHAISLSMLLLQTKSVRPAYEVHLSAEAAVAAALVTSLHRCCPQEDIFVATPHRIQRQAVKDALRKSQQVDDVARQLQGMALKDGSPSPTSASGGGDGRHSRATARLAVFKAKGRTSFISYTGSEAGFVICLFSLPPSATSDLAFMLQRRRLNVAISRAKTMCILVTSSVVLRLPHVGVLANEETAKGAFEARAWTGTITVDV
ncbi:hypothetical protein C8F01DRAFT_1243260 [Mycena amicta]|nr:hypothetical protein C8F01DRAFT_1243260 [Mycena amicta]